MVIVFETKKMKKKNPQERFDIFVKHLPEDEAEAEEMKALYISPTDIQREGMESI